MKSQKSNYKLLSFNRKYLDKQELDWEQDLKDLISSKIGTENFKEVISKWIKDDYLVVVKV